MDADIAEIREAMQERPGRKRRLWFSITVTASIVLATSIGSYFYLHQKENEQIVQNQVQDIAPAVTRRS